MAKTPTKAPPKKPFKWDPNLQKGKPGAPKGSMNAFRHGLKCANLPKSCRYIFHRLNSLRRILEAAVLESKGEINMVDGAAINTAIRWERAAQLHERRYRLEPDKYLDSPDKAATASERRDKAIAALRIDRDVRDNLIDSLYRLPAPNGKGTDEAA